MTVPPTPGQSQSPDISIEVDRVSKSFGTLTAVSDLSLTFSPGVTALLGPNGAGKSTLIRLLVGLERPSTGRVRIFGGDPRTSADTRSKVGIVPQQDGMFGRLTAFETVHVSAVLSKLDDAERLAREALQTVELDPDMTRSVDAFSKGMRQRVKVAQALVHDPMVIMLDEPLNGLDPRQRRHMISLFNRLGFEGKTVIVSSHVLDEVERFGSHVVVLALGRLAATGDYRAIRSLMDDQPARIRIVCDNARTVGAELMASGLVSQVEVVAVDTVEVRTVDVRTFRVGLTSICHKLQVSLSEISPIDDDLESVFKYLVEGPAR